MIDVSHYSASLRKKQETQRVLERRLPECHNSDVECRRKGDFHLTGHQSMPILKHLCHPLLTSPEAVLAGIHIYNTFGATINIKAFFKI